MNQSHSSQDSFNRLIYKLEKKSGPIFFLAAVLLFGIVALIPQLKTIHPLFDDFWLLNHLASNEWQSLIDQPTAGFYRPFFMLLAKLEFEFFAWRIFQGYSLVSSLFHICNSFLLSHVLRKSGASNKMSWVAAGIWLLLPVNNESIFWIASQNDLFASFFLLLSMLSARKSIDLNLRSKNYWLYALTGGFSLFLSLSCKESALFFWPFFAAICWRSKAKILPDRNFICSSFLLFLGAAAFAIIRIKLGGTSTQYGDPLVLYKQAALFKNLLQYAKFIFLLPNSSNGLIHITHWALIATFVLGILLSWNKIWSLLCLLAAIVAFLLPVLWMAVDVGSITGGRLVYVATFPVIWLVGIGLNFGHDNEKSLSSESRYLKWMKPLQLTLAILILIGSTLSLAYTQSLWAESAGVARQALHQVEGYLDEEKITVENLPSSFAGGPYILKCYAFRFYWAGRQKLPKFNCKVTVLTFDPEGNFIESAESNNAAANNEFEDIDATAKKLHLNFASSSECPNIDNDGCIKKREFKSILVSELKINNQDRLKTIDSNERKALLEAGWKETHYREDAALALFRQQNSAKNRIPLFRCFDGQYHSESKERSCNGGHVESLLGYLDIEANPLALQPLRFCKTKDSTYATIEDSCEHDEIDQGTFGYAPLASPSMN